MLKIFFAHHLLIFVGYVLQSLLDVVMALHEVRIELAISDIELVAFEFHIILGG